MPIVCLAVYLLLPLGPSSRGIEPRYVFVGFVSYTNDTSGRACARFLVTNPNPFAVKCEAFAAAYETNAFGRLQWVEAPARPHLLGPRQFVEVTVPKPRNNAAWRLVVPVTKPAGTRDMIRDFLARQTARVKYRMHLRAVDWSQHMGPPVAGIQTAYSPVVRE